MGVAEREDPALDPPASNPSLTVAAMPTMGGVGNPAVELGNGVAEREDPPLDPPASNPFSYDLCMFFLFPHVRPCRQCARIG